MLPLIAVLTFLAASLGAFEIMRPKHDPIRRRIALLDEAEQAPSSRRSRAKGSLGQRVIGPGLARAGRVLATLLPQNWIRGVDHMLVMANEPWSLPGFLGVWALSSGVGIAVVLYSVSAMSDATALQAGTVAVLIMSFAMVMPYARLRNKVRKRRKAIIRALPDAMDLLTTSVEAGLSVDSAFAMVADKTEGPLSEAFTLYLRQVGLGRAREDALVYVAERTGVPDLIGIAHNVNQGQELGTPLGDVLRRQAEELRMMRRQRAQLAAQRAPVLMTIPMSLCFLPAMGAVVVVPSILNLFRFIGGLGGG